MTRSDAQPITQAERQRQATRPGLAVRGTFSPARAWRPVVVARLAQTLHGKIVMDAFESLVAVACRGSLDFAAMDQYCVVTCSEIQTTSNELALHIAQGFLDGSLEFDECDQAMNSLFALMTSYPFFKATERVIPEIAFNVYLAFDAGEFSRPDDGPGEKPDVKYTTPMLRQLLGTHRAV